VELLERARNAYLERFSWVNGHADTWSVLRDGHTLALVVEALAALVEEAHPTVILGIEARGFLLGPAVARASGLGFVAVRKGAGLFPGPTDEAVSAPDYRGIRQRLRLRADDLAAHDVVALVDDWIETGSQASAARLLTQRAGARWAGCVVVVDQAEDGVREAVGPIRAVVPSSFLPEN
jgi:adenine phosphoribosyltransferase